MHFLTGFLSLIYLLSMGVSPHVLDLLACIGGTTLLLLFLGTVILVTELSKRVLRRALRGPRKARRIRRELFLLEGGTCDGRSPEELDALAEEAVRGYRRGMRGG